MSIDLSTVEGLTVEQSAVLTEMFTTQTAGLVTKNNELLNEKKTVQQSNVAANEALESARLAAVKANEEALKAAGDMEGLKTHYEQQLAEQTASANEQTKIARDALSSRDKSTALNSVMSLIHDDFKEVSKDMLSNIVNVTYNDKGEAVTSYKYNGEVVADSADSFGSWAKEQPAFSKILKGVDSSGADTNQSRSGASGGDTTASRLAARLKTSGIT